MTYRCRGGKNGRGGIIRGPPQKPLFQPEDTTNVQQSIDDSVIENDQHSPDQVTKPSVTPSPTSNDMSPECTMPSSSVNQTLDHNTNQQMICDETSNPAKTNAVLHPKGELWFTKHEVVKKVTKTSFKQFFDRPYSNLSMVSDEVRLRWWYSFRKEFSWDPSVAKLVKTGWEKKLRRRFSEVMSKLGRDENYLPKWCTQSMKDGLKKLRDTDKFKKKSAQCSKNKKNSPKGLSLHCQGSVSTEELIGKMIAKSGGQKPKPSDVFKRGHLKKNGSFVDNRSASFWDNLQKEEAANKEIDKPKTDAKVYFDVVGGFDAKGRIYGFGSAAESYFERPTTCKTNTKAPSQQVINMENRVIQLTSENQQQKEIINSTVQQMKLLQEQFQILSQQVTGCTNGSGISFPTPTPITPGRTTC